MKINPLKTVLLLLLFSIENYSYCQETNIILNKKHDLYISSGINHAWLKNNIDNYHLNSKEIFLGGTYKKNLTNNFSISGSILAGVKLKRKYDFRIDDIGKYVSSDYNNDIYYVLSEVDKFDRSLANNHYFIEIPLSFNFFLRKISASTGILARYYTPDRQVPDQQIYTDDIFNNKFEYGITLGLGFNLTEKVQVRMKSFIAQNYFYDAFVIIRFGDDMLEYTSQLKSRYCQFCLIYRF